MKLAAEPSVSLVLCQISCADFSRGNFELLFVPYFSREVVSKSRGLSGSPGNCSLCRKAGWGTISSVSIFGRRRVVSRWAWRLWKLVWVEWRLFSLVTALGRCGTQLPVGGFCVVLQGVAAADPCRFGTLVRAILTASYAAVWCGARVGVYDRAISPLIAGIH